MADAAGKLSTSSHAGKMSLELARLGPESLPFHVELSAVQSHPVSLEDFLKRMYGEAREDKIQLKKIGTAKSRFAVNGTTYPVVVEKLKSAEAVEPVWFGRSSEHDEASSVSYKELERLLMHDHERNEAQYTPAIYEVNTLMEWDCSHLEDDAYGVEDGEMRWFNKVGGQDKSVVEGDGGFINAEMRISQMHHQMPSSFLGDRFFTVLLVSFQNTFPRAGATAESFNMQIPIDLSKFPACIRERSRIHAAPSKKSPASSVLRYRNDAASASAAQKARNGREVVEGFYVSLERVLRVSKTESEAAPEKWCVEWRMRTASDAGGGLPVWLQRLGISSALVKDVPLALKCLVEKRE